MQLIREYCKDNIQKHFGLVQMKILWRDFVSFCSAQEYIGYDFFPLPFPPSPSIHETKADSFLSVQTGLKIRSKCSAWNCYNLYMLLLDRGTTPHLLSLSQCFFSFQFCLKFFFKKCSRYSNQNHRIIELLRLEKTLKIIKSYNSLTILP